MDNSYIQSYDLQPNEYNHYSPQKNYNEPGRESFFDSMKQLEAEHYQYIEDRFRMGSHNQSVDSKYDKSKLKHINKYSQERSDQLKPFLYGFFEKQNKLIESTLRRRKMYIDMAFSSGLDRRHTEILSELYHSPNSENYFEPGTQDDLEELSEALEESQAHRKKVLREQPLRGYEQDLAKIDSDIERLQRNLFGRLTEQREVRTLQISKYGYYDITSSMKALLPDEKKGVSHLQITNTSAHAAIVKGQMAPFIEQFATFTRLRSFSLKAWHQFNEWSCFDDLAEVINRKMRRLEWVELYINDEASKEHHINWADKLNKGIKVRIKEFAKEGLMSKVVAQR